MLTSTLPTDRERFRQLVVEMAEKAKATLPEANGRVDKAVALVLQGDVELLDDGTARVYSQSDGVTTYRVVNGTCDCADYERAPSHWCKHRISHGLLTRVQARMPQPEPVAPPGPPAPALPEAPASVNCHITVAGRQVQLTLRDTDEVRLLARLEEVLQRYPQPPAARQGASPPQGAAAEKRFCPRHGSELQRHENAKGVWYSHYVDGAHCKGR